LSGGKLAFFDWESKTYQPIPVEEQVEVASLVGDIAIGPDGKPSVAGFSLWDGDLRWAHTKRNMLPTID
jgi:hypothetical protein